MPLPNWRLDPGSAHRRVPELDGLRGIAAPAVIGYHVKRDWFPFGWAAVDLFFVLSGFLITGIILRDGDRPGFLRRFYLRRGLRIWPIYYLSIITLMVAHRLHLLPVGCRWSGLWPYLTYTQNIPDYWGGRSPVFHPWLRHTWTLAIEEQFYLLWPALVLLARRRHLVPLALACLAATVLARLGGVRMTLLLGRLDGLALGALLAAYHTRSASPLLPGRGPGRGGDEPEAAVSSSMPPRLQSVIRNQQTAILASALLLATLALTNRLGPYQPEPGATLTILAANLAAFGLVAWTVRHAGRRRVAPLRSPTLVLLGQMSYGLYLYHPMVLGYSAGSLGLSRATDLPPLRLALTLFACLAVATLSWFLIEKPLLALKDRLTPRSTLAPHPHLDEARAHESAARPS